MFSLDIVDTDLFLDMPSSTQNLYFHLGMRADDDGFVSSPRKITGMVNCSNDDLKLLIAKNFILTFETGVIVIKDWKTNNYIRSDRYTPTKYIDEKSELMIGNSGNYMKKTIDNNHGIPNSNHLVDNLDTQVRLDKISIDIDKNKDKAKKQLPTYVDDVALNNSIKEFIIFRKTAKKPMTEKAIKMLITKLNKLSSDSKTQIKILEQSIYKSWTDVYELKEEGYGANRQSFTGQTNTATEYTDLDRKLDYKG